MDALTQAWFDRDEQRYSPDIARGQVAGTVGAYGDLHNLLNALMVRMAAPQYADRLQLESKLPTTQSVGEAIGADTGSPEFVAGTFGSFLPMAGYARGMKYLPEAAEAGRAAIAKQLGRKFDAAYTPDANLPADQRVLQEALASQLRSDPQAALARYNEMTGGKITSVDDMRELSPEYVSNRSLSAAAHEPASALSKLHWQQSLDNLNPGDSVMLMSGGTGAGKTTTLNDVGINVDDYGAVFDSNLQDFGKAKKKIDEALDKGLKVEVAHIYRDPMEAFTGPGSALSRAMRKDEYPTGTYKKPDAVMKPNGRTVPIDAHIGTHKGSNETIARIQAEYADNPNVTVRIIDNTGGKGGGKPGDLGTIPEDLGAGVDKEALHEALYRAYLEQTIDRRTLEGFASKP